MAKKGFDYDEIKTQLEGLWGKTLGAITKGKSEVVRFSKIGKIKLDTQMMERDKNYLFQKMGEEAFKGIKAGKFSSESLNKYVTKIENIDKKIKSQTQKLTDLSRKKNSKPKTKKK